MSAPSTLYLCVSSEADCTVLYCTVLYCTCVSVVRQTAVCHLGISTKNILILLIGMEIINWHLHIEYYLFDIYLFISLIQFQIEIKMKWDPCFVGIFR